MNWKTTLLLCLGILGAGGALTVLIFFTEPTAERSGASKETAMLVETTTVQRDTVAPTIEAMGTVQPSQDITLSPRVEGEVLRRADAFTPGSYVEQGETLLQLDPSDYETALQQRKSELRQAEADLKLEMGRQNVAQQDYELLGDTLSERQEDLVLRKPQLNAARSAVESARAAVEQARLNLQRTTIKAPFDAHILSRKVNVGSQVDPSDPLGRLVGRDTYWVEATVPVRTVRRLSVANEGGEGAPVRIHNRSAWPEGAHREGVLFRVVGTLADETRMARVLVSVPDPHATRTEDPDAPRLMIGSYVEAQMAGTSLPNVVRLDRDYVRDEETAWVMGADGQLQIRDLDIVFRDATYAYIEEGLSDGDRVVTSRLSTVSEGAPLRRKEPKADSMASQ